MLKQLSVAVLGLSIFGLQACVAGSAEEESLEVGDVGQGVCASNAGVNEVLAGLAVAMADEIGELHPVRDLAISNGMVVLSATGRAKCAARAGCNNIDALLSLQNEGINSVVPNTVFNATNYRNTAVASYQRQLDSDNNLAMNNPSAIPDPHNLVFSGMVNNGACGIHYVFNAYKVGCTTGCDGLRAWDGGNWQFTVANGEVIKHNGAKYKANQAISFPNAECAPGAAAAWCASWFTKVGDCSQCLMDDPQDIVRRLAFFENGENPFLAPYTSNGQIAIDPSGTLNGDTTASSGSCTAAAAIYDATKASAGKCCSMSGKFGTFKVSSYNQYTFLCTL